MAQQLINIGTSANDGTGDPLRTGGDKINDNFTELYAAVANSGLTIGTTAIGSGTTTRILYDNAGILGEYTVTGSGTTAVLSTAPTFATSITTPSVLATAND